MFHVNCNLPLFLCYSRASLFFSTELRIYSIIPIAPWKLQNFPCEEINARCEARPNFGGGNKMNHALPIGRPEEQSCVWLMPEETLLDDKIVQRLLENFPCSEDQNTFEPRNDEAMGAWSSCNLLPHH